MAFDKNYPNRKDHRKSYRGGRVVSYGCRNHGSCGYCAENRQYSNVKRLTGATMDGDTLSRKEKWR